ncbi:MAG: DHH family phosphoesterase [Candidatus Marinimicrobia bacterium]|nr:DHH family phosphoesterase [Candidatus Neomarinimicrobiota bacterium]MCF7851190.1 DHH family phosphoesterase [Candidatus Neomarinimicrobiota bacterium]MCF7904152.1 DHH family phosphoesterase [Candidatus Neomarinimicrobiota bacterium]
MKRDWTRLQAVLADYDTFVFSTHVEPDADGLGSELALARYLTNQGKTVHILNPSDIRGNLDFLPVNGELETYNGDVHQSILDSTEIFIAFDIGHYSRLNALGEELKSRDILKLCIDHHPGDKTDFDEVFDYDNASSTGVLIYDLLSQLDKFAINDLSIAKPLYAAMMSDTGNFRFNNTDPETLTAAAHLVGTGVKPYEVYVNIYENLNTPGRLLVLQELLNTIQYDVDGKLAWALIDLEKISEQGVVPDDLHSLSDFIRSIKGVEVGVAFTKLPGRSVDVSIRSKGRVPINTVAREFGGGGHAFAAGCTPEGSPSEAMANVIESCKRAIAKGGVA